MSSRFSERPSPNTNLDHVHGIFKKKKEKKNPLRFESHSDATKYSVPDMTSNTRDLLASIQNLRTKFVTFYGRFDSIPNVRISRKVSITSVLSIERVSKILKRFFPKGLSRDTNFASDNLVYIVSETRN